MSRLRRSVPSLGALVTFEVAARLGGFTRAAEELGVTQAAVSRQIKALECDLGVDLFLRQPRALTLTAEGRRLAEVIGESFAQVATAIDDIRAPRRAQVLTIGATLAFSHFWLLPRLPNLRAARPEMKLRVVSQDEPFDLRNGGVDLVLRYGRPPFADGGRSVALLAERIFPVCSPQLPLATMSAAALPDLPLIESDGPEISWYDWDDWFARAKITRVRAGRGAASRERSLQFNHYSDAVYAAINGEGVALGWQSILERPLSDGRLVQVADVSVVPSESHHVVVPSGRPTTPVIDAFVDWISAAFEAP